MSDANHDSLKRIVDLADQMRRAAENVAAAEAALAAAKSAYVRIEQDTLPELMREVGVTSLTLGDDGTKLELVEDVACGITQERAAAAFNWLEAHGFDGMIKTQVTATFGRGEAADAAHAADALSQLGHAATLSRTVHPSTLKSFIKEQMAAGRPPPFDVFGIHPLAKAKLVPPPKPKAKPPARSMRAS